MPDLYESFRAVVAALDDARVPYAVCGGIALAIHGQPRATIDIDLLAPRDAIPRMVEALEPVGFVRREREPSRLAEGRIVMHRFGRIVTGDPEVLLLDVIEVRAGATETAWATRTSVAWEGRRVPVVSAEGLITLKRVRGAPQDLADIAALERSP